MDVLVNTEKIALTWEDCVILAQFEQITLVRHLS